MNTRAGSTVVKSFATSTFRSHKTRARLVSAAGLVLALTAQRTRAVTYSYINTADQGLWTTAGSWSPGGPPVSGSDVLLGNHSAGVSNLNVTYNYLASGTNFNSVTLNSSALTGYMILNQTASSSYMSSNVENIGTSTPDNTYNQSAGTNSCNTLNVGVNSGSDTYFMSGTAYLVNISINLGVSGSGTLNQTNGGIISREVVLGTNSGSAGTYIMSGGTYAVDPSLLNQDIIVGQSGSGLLSQNGGTITINEPYNQSDVMYIGYGATV